MSDKLYPTVSKIDVSSVFDTDEESFGKMMDIIHNPNPLNKEYTEKHHIIPRFVFRNKGLDIDNSPDNIVELSLKNHFLVHYYASKCCKNEYKYRFAVAVTKMLGHIYDNFSEDELEKIATMVEEAKENVRKLGYPETAREKNRLASLGDKNGFYGRTHTDESKKVMSEKAKLRWKEHPEMKERIIKMNKDNAGKTPWNAKIKNKNPNEKVKCGNYKLKGKSLPREWCEAAKSGRQKSQKTSIQVSKHYRQYKEEGGTVSWNEYQKIYKKMIIDGCII